MTPEKQTDSTNLLVFFLGGVWSKKEEATIISDAKGTPVQFAANVFQWKLIHGLSHLTSHQIRVISAPFVGSYPLRNRRLFVDYQLWGADEGLDHNSTCVSHCNLFGIKHLLRARSLFREFERQIRTVQEKGSQTVVIGYAMTPSTVLALLFVKRAHPTVQCCLVVPDLPNYMDTDNNSSAMKRQIKYYANKWMYKAIAEFDKFVVLTEQMIPALGVAKPCLVIEGIADENQAMPEEEGVCHTEIRKIVYTGTLNERYGIRDLVNAFVALPDRDISLEICGNGDSAEWLKNISITDARIHYYGSMQHSFTMELQREAYLLVNPRKNNEEFTKYSFPSKIMEYLSSGRPILAYKLPGIPDEYDEYINYISSDLQSSLRLLLDSDWGHLSRKAERGMKFVNDKKSVDAQAARLISFLTSNWI